MYQSTRRFRRTCQSSLVCNDSSHIPTSSGQSSFSPPISDMRVALLSLLCALAVVEGKWVQTRPHSFSLSVALPSHSRARRDVTCASFGHDSCSLSCRLRGRAGGECTWDTNTAAFNCVCQEERRGVRCNVGGQHVCHYSCRALGHTAGECDDQFDCKCSGRRVRFISNK